MSRRPVYACSCAWVREDVCVRVCEWVGECIGVGGKRASAEIQKKEWQQRCDVFHAYVLVYMNMGTSECVRLLESVCEEPLRQKMDECLKRNCINVTNAFCYQS